MAPTNVLPKASSGTKVTVTWSAPNNPGGLPIAHYIIFRGSSTSSLAQVALTNLTTYTDISVTPGTTYVYAIESADNGLPPAQSGYSAPASVTTYSLPQPPANLVATPSSCTKMGLTWSPSVTGGLPIANYRVYRGTSPSNLVQIIITTKTSYTDINLTAQTNYYYAVQAGDTGTPPDLSALSGTVSATTYGYPSAPTNVLAVPVSSSKITITWSAAVSGGLPISNYHVYGGTSPTGLTQLAVTPNLTYSNVLLKPATTYYYSVQASDTAADNSPMSGTVSATTFPLPTTPSNVTCTAPKSTQIALAWSASTGNLPISYYYVLRGASPSSLSQIGTTTKVTYNDNTVTSGVTYYYSIQSGDTANDRSLPSSPVACSTQ
jgi:fibronectin type 3 domain-containing protein